jgi:hypothetical protein
LRVSEAGAFGKREKSGGGKAREYARGPYWVGAQRVGTYVRRAKVLLRVENPRSFTLARSPQWRGRVRRGARQFPGEGMAGYHAEMARYRGTPPFFGSTPPFLKRTRGEYRGTLPFPRAGMVA